MTPRAIINRRSNIIAAILCAAAVSAVLALIPRLFAQNESPRSPSVWDGVYSRKQAAIGEDRYQRSCQHCHGDDLEGDIVEHPQLAGGDFLDKWNGLNLGQLFERIHRDMPMDAPGTLSRDTAIDLIAYILSENHFPAGDVDLPRDTEILRQIRIERERPQSQKSK